MRPYRKPIHGWRPYSRVLDVEPAYSLREIGVMLGISEQAVNSRLRKAIVKMRLRCREIGGRIDG